MKKQLIQAVFAVIAYCGISLSAYAAPIDGTSSCVFQNAQGPTTMVNSGVGSDTFTWGTGGNGTEPSSLVCEGQSIAGTIGSFFDIGEITYFNGTIVSGTGADSVDLSITIDFTNPFGANEMFTYLLSLINTPNTGSAQAQADIVQFPIVLPTETFNIAGILYTLALEVGNVTTGGFSTQNTFSVLEGQSATANLRGKITIADVPAPGTLALLGLSLAGLSLARRSTKK
ncbi:THxN family PEP-CTERM protein [Brumicola pallidula]|uniref:Ice-binding protein C-terminal domain-containing protein n=1 Tax=Brumicola pallidula DSM 14239 = ACAM 615 TaxID=1121922 RepID=K6ZCK6_9ALTE|nr:THxN family PEP-CTERM protein [Glaciecola pallidula]GAC28087.1 hypothetical protein GPAL_1214 [Glaciecola pallidula DSM 14239 = ACAM 615]